MRLYKRVYIFSTYFIDEKTNCGIGKEIFTISSTFRYKDSQLNTIKLENFPSKYKRYFL